MRDYKKIIIIVIISLIIILSMYLIIKRNKVVFYLKGDETIIIRYGTTYTDPGVIATDGFGNDISEYVKVYGTVNPLVLGTYRLVYEIDYHGKKTLERLVLVQNIPIDDLEIKLNGEEVIYLLKDNPYIEEEAYIYNRVDDFILDNETLNIQSDVDTSKVGNYLVNYILDYGDRTISVTRKVVVFDIDYYITPEELTSDIVEINIDLSNIDNYLNEILIILVII